MKSTRAVLVIALTLVPFSAQAGERVGDAALGALSGAVVFGPVGLVAGALVGFTAGPAIAKSWRDNRHHPRHSARSAKRPTRVAAKSRPAAAPAQPEAGSVAPQPTAKGSAVPVNGFE